MNLNEKHPDYLIIDNFLEHTGLTKQTLEGAENLGYVIHHKSMRPNLSNRQDLMVWFRDLAEKDQMIPELATIAKSM